MDMKKHLDAYNKAVGSLEARVLTSARRFRELEAVAEQKIDALEGIERATRALQGADFEVEVPV